MAVTEKENRGRHIVNIDNPASIFSNDGSTGCSHDRRGGPTANELSCCYVHTLLTGTALLLKITLDSITFVKLLFQKRNEANRH